MIKFLNPRCEKCGHFAKNGACLLDKSLTDKEGLCRYYTESPYICELCGKHLISIEAIFTSGNQHPFHIICRQCIEKIGKCNTCQKAANCRFENDNTVPEPAYVMQTIRQGPMVTQTQVKNPKRINLTCKAGCSCYINGECERNDGGYCDNYICAVENW